MTDVERSEAARVQPGVARELGQSLSLMALLAGTLTVFLGLGLLAVRVLG
jgi:hypothetical protein